MTHSEPAMFIDDHDDEMPAERRSGIPHSLLTRRIDTLHLAARSHKALLQSNLFTIGDIVRHHEKEILAITNFGPKSLSDLKKVLSDRGLTMGIRADEYSDNVSKESPQSSVA